MPNPGHRLFLLDASNFIFRAFHSTNPRDRAGLSTSAGMPTNALLVFTNMVRKLLRDHQPTHFAAVFDPKGKGFRSELYPDYKANRKETPPDLVVQFPYFRPLLSAMGIPCVEAPRYEADDVIATLARRAEAAGWEAVLISSDKDLYQLLSDKIRMFDGMKDRWIDLDTVHKKFGVGPDRVVQVQALMGDSVDNVPGVPGVGPKTAAKLIVAHGDLDGVYAAIDTLKGKLKERMVQNKELAYISRDLVRLATDAPVAATLDDLAIGAQDTDTLVNLFRELEFKTLTREYQRTAPPAASTRTVVLSWAALRKLLARLETCTKLSVEVLSDRAETVRADLVGLAIGTGPNESWYIPVGHRFLGAQEQLPAQSVLGELSPWLLGTMPAQTLAHGHKAQSVVLGRAGLAMRQVGCDTELTSYVRNPTRYAHTLENIALDLTGLKLPDIPKDIAKGRSSFAEAAFEQAAEWALARVEAVLQVAPLLLEDLPDALAPILEMEHRLAAVLADMETTGVVVDATILAALSQEFGTQARVLELRCHELAGAPFNLGSPKQLAEVLFKKLGLPVIKKTKTGASTDASVLDQLKDKHPLVPTLLEWRSLTKLKNTYTDVLPTLINPETGRIHTSLRQTVAATGRLSSFDPNLQNIPIRTEAGRRIRDAFVAAPGTTLMSADYSQIELRVLAHLSGDPGLVKAFLDDTDIHRRTAAEIFGVDEDAVTREQRSAAKSINFGLMYGMGAFRLANELHIPRAQAQAYIDLYFERFPKVKGYMEGTIARGQELGYVETLFGRRRYVPELRSRNFSRRSSAERAAINAPVQGTAADLIKMAMLEIPAALKAAGLGATMLLQVHDELLFEVPTGQEEATLALVTHQMESVYALAVPLRVSAASGQNWNEAH